MSLLIKIVCPAGIITATDTREIYSKIIKSNGNKKILSHINGVSKSFLKNGISIAITGNAYIDKIQLKDFFPQFLNALPKNITFDNLLSRIKDLYKNKNNISTNYYFSFYDEISENSIYKKYYMFEPFIFRLNTENMELNRLNVDEDGFVFGFFWGGETDIISESLKIKRENINANKFTIETSIKLIKEIFQETQNEFIERKEYPTISENFDLTIQTSYNNELFRDYK